jgi:LacI family transcriptional regulator
MKRALDEAGIAYHPEWTHDSAIYEEGGEQLTAWFLRLEKRPTAMCVNNDVVASVFVQQLYRAGLKVPDDVSVIGHDDSPIAKYCMVPLTVVTQPIWSEAEKAASLLSQRLNNEYDGPPRILIATGELVLRDSVRRLAPKVN